MEELRWCLKQFKAQNVQLKTISNLLGKFCQRSLVVLQVVVAQHPAQLLAWI
jgi:ABC-type cobalamin/Fe3+-siderophores transport system ATPase subunit